jgi:hypothetical protein
MSPFKSKIKRSQPSAAPTPVRQEKKRRAVNYFVSSCI